MNKNNKQWIPLKSISEKWKVEKPLILTLSMEKYNEYLNYKLLFEVDINILKNEKYSFHDDMKAFDITNQANKTSEENITLYYEKEATMDELRNVFKEYIDRYLEAVNLSRGITR